LVEVEMEQFCLNRNNFNSIEQNQVIIQYHSSLVQSFILNQQISISKVLWNEAWWYPYFYSS